MPKIFISRSLSPNSSFKKELTEKGMEIIGQSLIQFSPTPFNPIPVVDWIFFYSKNGVKFFLETIIKTPLLKKYQRVKWAAMGAGTAVALSNYLIKANFIGNGQPAETALAFEKVAKGQKVLFPRAKNSKKSIQRLLVRQIEQVDLVVYENEVVTNCAIPFCEILVFTSPLNAQTYFQKYPINPKQKVITIGKTTEKTLQQLGIQNIKVANHPSEESLAEAVISLLN